MGWSSSESALPCSGGLGCCREGLSSSPEELAPGSFFPAFLAAKLLAEQLCHAG